MRKAKTTIAVALVGFVGIPFGAMADDKETRDGGTNWLQHVREAPSKSPRKSAVPENDLGNAALEAKAARVITLKPMTKWANVQRGETVTFVYGAKSFTWYFDTLGTPNFALAEIAPKDFGTGHIRVYVGPNASDSNG